MPAYQRAIFDLDKISCSASAQESMSVPRGYQRQPADHGIIVGSFFHADPAKAIQPLGEAGREMLRHVLHDHNTWSVMRQPLKKLT
jgi:hypothetical protein